MDQLTDDSCRDQFRAFLDPQERSKNSKLVTSDFFSGKFFHIYIEISPPRFGGEDTHFSSPMSWSHLVENFRAAKGKPQACFIVGATGQIGRSLLEEALGCGGFHRVITIARQPIFYKGPNSDLLCEMIIPDFEDLHQALIDSSILKNCSYGFCCLGTTRSKAGSKVSFIICFSRLI